DTRILHSFPTRRSSDLATTDIEYRFPFGWGELWGIASRTDYDLKQHSEHSGEDFQYHDQETGEKYLPYCIEPSLGADRVTQAFRSEEHTSELQSRFDLV